MSNPATVAPDLVPVGKLPELGVVPQKMKGFVIREERFGEPEKSFVEETVPVPELGDEIVSDAS